MGVGQINIRLAVNKFSNFKQLEGGVWLDGMLFSDRYVNFFIESFGFKPEVLDYLDSKGRQTKSFYWYMDNNEVSFFVRGVNVDTIHIRLNLVEFREDVLLFVIDFAVMTSCIFVFMEDKKCVEPDEAKLREAIASSRATALLQYI